MSFEDKREINITVAVFDMLIDFLYIGDAVLTLFIPHINKEGMFKSLLLTPIR